MFVLLLAVTLVVQVPGRDSSTFRRRVAELELAAARKAFATSPDANANARATLKWLRALQNVLKAIPIERASGPHEAWVKANEDLILYSEPAGEWLIRHDLLLVVHADHAKSAVADDIAWLAVENGLPGECEGYIPCYASSLNMLEGEYLRAHPRGAHRQEAFDRIVQSLDISLDDLLKRPDSADFLTVPRDCGDLLAGMRPLRAAIAAAGGAGTKALALADRAIAICPK